jgi:membrane-bound lytic murein transglycosylase A
MSTNPRLLATIENRRVAPITLALLFSALLFGCVTQPKPTVHVIRYERASFGQLPGWDGDNLREAWNAFLISCRALRFRAEWGSACAAAVAVTDPAPGALRNYFEQYFEPYKILKVPSPVREDTGLITGYYEPQVLGARAPSAEFTAPLYAPPSDLLVVDLASVYPELKGKHVRGRLDGNRVVPYYTRAQLSTDPAVRGTEIVWINNALDALLLEIQGSGRVQLPNGEVIRLQYADQNGQPYRSIGRYLVEKGQLTVEQATIPGIRAWLAANPQRTEEVLDADPSVVFFNEAPLGDPNIGPKGAQGVPLTPGRSIAVDPAIIPLGSPVFLATTQPASDVPLQRLVIAQDTGGAITGAPRADFFWGTGSEAAEKAGKMRQRGSLWLLWPRNVPLPPG